MDVFLMGFWFLGKKNDEGQESNRVVQEPDLKDFVVPSFMPKPQEIREHDKEIVDKLTQEFLSSGVISDTVSEDDNQLSDAEADELMKVFEEINLTAKNEADFHENVEFDDSAYQSLREYEEDMILSDEIDDYGQQILALTDNYDDDV